uniref:Uncharacterized protein n=1 Tax=Proboscia inermis TaxID=420281 RepID=A0A7S0CM03_9STRA|mmetsp:Transcript_8317/g.8492  ORF Transcript_8317/g.8492 Transcript_8317/m.8492 type:complete len:101 (+) Transcript_8317:101-403(+)
MLLLPVSMLQSVGVGASFAILCALAVNLSLTPAILSTKWLGDFVLHRNRILSMICCIEHGNPGRTKLKVPNATSSGREGVMKSYENSDGAVGIVRSHPHG